MSLAEFGRVIQIKLHVPYCCGECVYVRIIENDAFCGNYNVSPEMKMLDISSLSIDLSKRPEWCPIVALNRKIDALPEEKQEALDNFSKALETLFGWNGEAK